MPIKEFLIANVFIQLKNLNDGFDAESIYYFSESDFEKVLERVETFGLGIYGIEPWKDKEFYGVLSCEDYNKEPNDPSWYKEAFKSFKQQGQALMYSATYCFPEDLE